LQLLASGGSRKRAKGLQMSSNNFAIKVEDLSKCYHIYNQPQDRLKQSIIPRLQMLAGRTPSAYFREFWALRGVSFEVEKGKTVGIIGRNGSGKSTLLQLICGTLTPTHGLIWTHGRVAALLELGSGFNPEFTGRENVHLNGAVLGLSRDEIESRFDDIAAFADIGDFIEQPVKMYSSGMVVRLAFAIQAMVDPDILIVDEALAVGDEKFQRKCFARLEELKSRGTSILFVSHSVEQIIELCEKALLLEHGSRLMYGRPLDVIRAYQRLIYAPDDEQKQLIQEYQTADRLGQIVTTPKLVKIANTPLETSVGDFDSGLIPQTTEVYPVRGAEIDAFRILDMDGHVVNLLRAGREYRFEVSGRFLSDTDRVFFGIHIRSISGTVITGQRHPEEGKFLERVQAGQRFRINYGFKLTLLPGIYFVGGGIWSASEPSCLHRILDALMFRVVYDRKMNSLGLVDTSSNEPFFEVM
jgi:lipopolysaccharide transport system ATP-binding protein